MKSLVFVESLFFETLMSFTATREQLCLRIILLAKALCIEEQKQEEQIKCCTQTSIKQFTCTTPLFKKPQLESNADKDLLTYILN